MTNQPTREDTMREDPKFLQCAIPELVVIAAHQDLSKAPSLAAIDEIAADALARIAALSPRTVTDDQRTRAISAAIDYRSRPADVLVDRIIDALGWTAAEPERDCENCGGRKCMSCCSREMHDDCADDCPMCCPAPAPPAPVVELTAPQLESLAGIVRAHERTAIDLGPIAFSLRSVPMVVEDMPERDGVKLDGISMLRIGGGQ